MATLSLHRAILSAMLAQLYLIRARRALAAAAALSALLALLMQAAPRLA